MNVMCSEAHTILIYFGVFLASSFFIDGDMAALFVVTSAEQQGFGSSSSKQGTGTR